MTPHVLSMPLPQVGSDALLTSSLSTFGFALLHLFYPCCCCPVQIMSTLCSHPANCLSRYVAAALFPKRTGRPPSGHETGAATTFPMAVWVAPYGTIGSAFSRADSPEPCMHFYRASTGSCEVGEPRAPCAANCCVAMLTPSADRRVC